MDLIKKKILPLKIIETILQKYIANQFIFLIWMTEVTRSLIRVKLFMLDLNAYCWTFHCKATPVQPLHASGGGRGGRTCRPMLAKIHLLELAAATEARYG